jgi:outer membrane protein TolC
MVASNHRLPVSSAGVTTASAWRDTSVVPMWIDPHGNHTTVPPGRHRGVAVAGAGVLPGLGGGPAGRSGAASGYADRGWYWRDTPVAQARCRSDLTRAFERYMICNMRIRILIVAAWCAPLIASAQGTELPLNKRFLSLRECINLALSRNLDLQIEHLTVDIAGFNLNGSYGAYIPEFSLQARQDYLSQPSNFDPNKPGPDYPFELSTGTVGSMLSGRLPLGLSYEFNGTTSGEDARTDFGFNQGTALGYPGGIRQTNNYLAGAGVTVRQHLLKDFWIDQYREKILVRRKDLKISQEALRFQIMKTVLAVELAYYGLVAAKEGIGVQEKSLELKRQLVAETGRRVEVGDLPPLDSEQAETQLQNVLTALAKAREIYVDRQNTLKAIITDNFREWADLNLELTDALLAVPAELNRSASFQNALKKRPDLQEARLAVQKSAVSVKFQKNQLFPSLDFVGSYGGLGIQPGLNSAISDTLHFQNPVYFYGAVLSFPLGNLTERNNYRASKAAKQIAELQLKKAEQDVLVQVADYVNQVGSRFPQVGSTHKARTYAEAALAAEEKKLKNGLSTTFMVLQLQETLIAARTAEVQALADYNEALAQLAFAEGSTLEKHHLALEAK